MQLDLTSLSWTLVGWWPFNWAWQAASGKDITVPDADLRAYQCTPLIAAQLPGSVQDDLLRAGLLPDWHVGSNAPLCEWVEHRHWEYRCDLLVPPEWEGRRVVLRAEGLDYCGHVLVNGRTVASFSGMLMPHEFDLTASLRPGARYRLSIVFEEAPHEQAQIGYTSRSRLFKARYAYQWDWCPRLVPIGIWDRLALVAVGPVRLRRCLPYARWDSASSQGELSVRLDVESSAQGALACHVILRDGAAVLADELLPCAFGPGRSETTIALPERLLVRPWWPNGMGDRPLYQLSVELQTLAGSPLDRWEGTVGFKQVRWIPCVNSPANAQPWLCEVNGQPVFLQGVNWVPPRMTYGSVTDEMYRERLALYAELGMNILRIWGGSIPEKDAFYALCDELGLLVWQEFPLSSSGIDNYPPEDPAALAELAQIAASYVWRRGGHVSHLLWCGGNELTTYDRRLTPVNESHPAMACLAGVAARLDPGKRFVATSPSGPSFSHDPAQQGLGLHHDVHGPWAISGTMEEWKRHWDSHDGLFVSEVGAPSCSSVEILQRYAGDLNPWPPTLDNPYWRYRSPWWVQWHRLAPAGEFRADADELARYVEASQQEQAKALSYMVASCKRRFPRCGGVILWMGHDIYPCPTNTAIVDFHGQPKPAALALRIVYHADREALQRWEADA